MKTLYDRILKAISPIKKPMVQDTIGFYFFLQAIKYDDLPNNIKKIIKMSNIPDIKDEYSVEYYIGISDNIKINDCYMEEYYLILR